MNDDLVDPLQSTESELNQIITFLEDIKNSPTPPIRGIHGGD